MLALKFGTFNVLRLDHTEFFSYAHDGTFYLLPSSCPHRGGPLRLGSLEGDTIVCPWHRSRVPIQHCIGRALPIVVRHYRCELLVAIPKAKYRSIATLRREIAFARHASSNHGACNANA